MSKKKLKMLKLIPFIELGLVIVLAGLSCLLSGWLAGRYVRTEKDHEIKVESLYQMILSDMVAVLLVIIVVSCIAITAVCISKKVRRDSDDGKIYRRTWIVSGISAFLLLLGSFFFINGPFGDNDPKCFEFTDGNHMIVIQEESFLLGGWGNVYQINDDDSAVRLERFSTDDGYRNQGRYEIKWSDDSADITYDNGQGGKETVTVKFK